MNPSFLCFWFVRDFAATTLTLSTFGTRLTTVDDIFFLVGTNADMATTCWTSLFCHSYHLLAIVIKSNIAIFELTKLLV